MGHGEGGQPSVRDSERQALPGPPGVGPEVSEREGHPGGLTGGPGGEEVGGTLSLGGSVRVRAQGQRSGLRPEFSQGLDRFVFGGTNRQDPVVPRSWLHLLRQQDQVRSEKPQRPLFFPRLPPWVEGSRLASSPPDTVECPEESGTGMPFQHHHSPRLETQRQESPGNLGGGPIQRSVLDRTLRGEQSGCITPGRRSAGKEGHRRGPVSPGPDPTPGEGRRGPQPERSCPKEG
jgi:hypothetical protein